MGQLSHPLTQGPSAGSAPAKQAAAGQGTRAEPNTAAQPNEPAVAPSEKVPSGNVQKGAELYQAQGCAACHKINGQGGPAGPDLSDEANKGRSADWLAAQIRNAKAHNANSILSSALNMGVVSCDLGNDLPCVLILPSYAATARYHGRPGERMPQVFERTLQKVEAWALEEYIVSLARGTRLSEAQFRQTASRLAEYTGLPEELIAASHLRIRNGDFIQELLRAQNRTLGLLDGRVTMTNARSRQYDWTDPSLFLVQGPFVTAFNRYVRTELGFKTDLAYVFLSEQANRSWNWGGSQHGYLNVAPILAEAMNLDNRLQVFAAAGYYDLTTPYLSQEYVFDHLNLSPDLRKNITFRRYQSGHQIYTSTDSLRELTSDVRAFMTKSRAP